MTDSPRATAADGENTTIEKRSPASACVKVNTFQTFQHKFLREMSSPHFGDDIYSVDQYSKTAGAKELEKTGAKDILSKDTFLRCAHKLLREYARLINEQKQVRQVSADMGRSIKKLRDSQKTLQRLHKNILALDERLGSTLTVACRRHLDKAVTELMFVEDVLRDREKTQSSHIHPALRQKHDRGSQRSKYEVSQFKSLLPSFDYELVSLNGKAPQQWLLITLDSELQTQFKRANPKVSDITRHRVIAAVLKSGGLPAISAETIKQHFIEKRKPAKLPARNSQAT